MSHRIECVTGEGTLHVFKLARGWKRNLAVQVKAQAGGQVRKAGFPADLDHLEIDGLDPDAAYTVTVQRSRIWERFRHAAEEFTITPRTQDLRLLVTGSGRSGTKTFAHFFDGLRFTDGTTITARHEPLSDWVLEALAAGDADLPVLQQRGALHNVETAPYYSLYPDVIRADKVVLVIRDGRRVVQSGLNRGWYTDNSPWNSIKRDYGGDQFENACHLWVDANTGPAPQADAVFRLEDLVSDGGEMARLCTVAGVDAAGKELPHSNRGRQPSTGFADWSPEQHRTFASICGELMDRHYPEWRQDG